MSSLPLGIRLKKRLHREVALAQDILVSELFSSFPQAVLHGGTVIWRCYKGNRFSEDVDVYMPSTRVATMEGYIQALESRNLTKAKFRRTDRAIFARFTHHAATVSLEAVVGVKKRHVVKPFEMVDGSFITVNTLSPEELAIEKASAYMARRKVRDLYDLFFLIRLVQDNEKVRRGVTRLLANFQKPEDERELKTLILSGSVPTVQNMMEEMRLWAR